MTDYHISGSFGVDAGNIGVADLSYIEKNGGLFGDTAKRMCSKLEVVPGTYSIKMHCDNTWKGEIDENFQITTEGVLVFGDICYFFSSGEVEHDVWSDFLDKTDFLEESNDNFIAVSTGGDGEFDVSFTLKKVK